MISPQAVPSWSYSMYSDAVKCLQYFHYVYVDRLAPPQDIPNGDLIFGSALHSALNASLRGEDGEDVFLVYWDSYKTSKVKYGRYRWDALRSLGKEFIRKYARHGKKSVLLKGEERLYAEYSGVRLEGTPDFIGTYDGVPCVADFKTSAYNYDKDRARISLQLYLYAYLAIQNGVIAPRRLSFIVFNKSGSSIQLIHEEYSESLMRIHLDNMTAYCKMLGDEPPKRNPNSCIIGQTKCQYFDVCWKMER